MNCLLWEKNSEGNILNECKCADQLRASPSAAQQSPNPGTAGLTTRAFNSMQSISLTRRQASLSSDGKGGKVIIRSKAGLFEATRGRAL